jgi:hypothetical protein
VARAGQPAGLRGVVLMPHQVHTVTGPLKTYGSYPDPLVAQHIADRYADVLHVPLVVEQVEADATEHVQRAAEVAR